MPSVSLNTPGGERQLQCRDAANDRSILSPPPRFFQGVGSDQRAQADNESMAGRGSSGYASPARPTLQRLAQGPTLRPTLSKSTGSNRNTATFRAEAGARISSLLMKNDGKTTGSRSAVRKGAGRHIPVVGASGSATSAGRATADKHQFCTESAQQFRDRLVKISIGGRQIEGRQMSWFERDGLPLWPANRFHVHIGVEFEIETRVGRIFGNHDARPQCCSIGKGHSDNNVAKREGWGSPEYTASHSDKIVEMHGELAEDSIEVVLHTVL